jgi:hypothetical protein
MMFVSQRLIDPQRFGLLQEHLMKRIANKKHRIVWLLPLIALPVFALWSCTGGGGNGEKPTPAPSETQKPQEENSMRLWETTSEDQSLRVKPGSQAGAEAYYAQLQQKLVGFQPSPFTNSTIGDMLVYYGFPALLATDLERLEPAKLMDFAKLRDAVTNKPDFAAAYDKKPLQPGEIVASRFFAPKIINVGDQQTGGVPKDGFGWRKVLRFKARDGSAARSNGLDAFYLLFNFLSTEPKFPENKNAGQIQGILVPTYPTGGKHNDIYFLVYVGLGKENPGKIGFFLEATFDLASSVPVDGKYYVPISCGQCHGTEKPDQAGGKVNYLDTDHWIDRTGDDFTKVNPADVLVDGEALGYDTIRKLNTEIEKQNSAVITGNAPKFALLAVRKWLDLHKENQANRHVPPLERGLVEAEGDPVWTAGADPDQELLPLMNRYCFRCHSSVRFHVFQKKAVIDRKKNIIDRVTSGNMPQDRRLDPGVKDNLLKFVNKLP